MNIEKRSFLNRLTLKNELFFSFFFAFLFFVAGILAIVSLTYSVSVESTYLKQVVSTSQQALSNYSNYMDNVITASDAIQKRLLNETNQTIQSQSRNFFDEIMVVSPSIKSIALYDDNGKLIASDKDYQSDMTQDQIKKEEWFSVSLSSPLINHFSKVTESSLFTLSKFMTIDNGKESAILKVDYDFSGIESVIDESQLGEGGNIYIFDNDYQEIYASLEISDAEKEAIRNTILGQVEIKDGENHIYLYLSTIPKTRWRLAIATNINEISKAKTRLFINAFLFSVFALLAFLFLFYAVSGQISKPIVRLQKKMESIESLNFSPQGSYIGGTKEIVSLNHSYLKMMKKIRELAEEVVNEQKEQNKAELKAMQNQINPHFLYNTLDSIIYLIDENENKKAQNMIVALSRFFRISISRGKNIIPVRSELDHVRYYLEIQKMRFGDGFDYDIDAQEEILSLPVIKLILQPIVENAIVHGLGEKPLPGSHISIKGYLRDDYLIFEIQDNGYGMLPEKIDEINRSFKDKTIHNGVGLSNVYQRIRIYYGDKADIEVKSNPDAGTDILILIPKKEIRNDEE